MDHPNHGNIIENMSFMNSDCQTSVQIRRLSFTEKVPVMFLNFGTPEIFAVIYLKFKQGGQTLKGILSNGENGIENSGDTDQTAPLGAV